MCCTAGPTEPELPEAARAVHVSWRRFAGWAARFDSHHPGTGWTVGPDVVQAASPDGSWVWFEVPLGPLAEQSMNGLVRHLVTPRRLGVVLVRRGGFAVARLAGTDLVASKVGRRHVQGRSKAGGWSQQRFARRRDNQARAAFDAAADQARAILLPEVTRLEAVIVGGDRAAVDAVLDRGELAALAQRPRLWVDQVGDPRRHVLLQAIEAAQSLTIHLVDTTLRVEPPKPSC